MRESKSSISVSASLTEYGFARYPLRSVVSTLSRLQSTQDKGRQGGFLSGSVTLALELDQLMDSG